jgi:protein-disulfide isomerase
MVEQKITKNEKRENARAKATAMRIAEKKRSKRRRFAGWLTAGLGVLTVGGLIISVIIGNANLKVDASLTAPSNMGTDGVILTSSTEVVKNAGYNLENGTPLVSKEELAASEVPEIEIYVDYACPHCAEFEEANNTYMKSLLDSGRATIEIKPVVVLNLDLSYKGGNTLACLASSAPEKVWEYNSNTFSKITASGTIGSIPKSVVNDLGLEGDLKSEVNACMTSNEYGNWLGVATDNALARTDASGAPLVTGTPTVLVDGFKYPYSPADFQTFMEAVLQGASPQEVVSIVESAQTTP